MKRIFPLLLACSSAAIADEAIETIVVTAAKTPISKTLFAGNIRVIDEQTLKNSKAVSVAELLRGMAGIAVSQSGGFGALTELRTRGSESNHTLVMIDGTPLNDISQSGVANLANISLNNVARIEIIRGGQSALWGSGAVAGVINIITKSGAQNQTNVSLLAGSHQQRQVSFDHQHKATDSQFSIGLSYLDNAGENIALEGDEKDGQKQLQLSSRGQWQATQAHSFSYQLRWLESDNGFDSDIDFDGLLEDTQQKTDTEQQLLKLDWDIAQQAFDHRLSISHSEFDNVTTDGGVFSNQGSSQIQSLAWLTHKHWDNNNHLNIQIEYQNQQFDSRAPVVWGDSNQSRSNDIFSAILDGIVHIHPKVSLNASVRHDKNRIYQNSDSYNLGANWYLNNQLKLFANHSTAIKNPSYTETFGFFPASFIGNPELTPEHSVSSEIGLQYQLASWQFAISIYQAQLEEEIITVFNPDNTSTAINRTGDSERNGAEVTLLGSWNDWSIDANIGYLEATESDGIEELRRPRNSAQITLSKRFLDRRANWFLQANYQGSQDDFDFSTWPSSRVELTAYTLINSTLSYQINPQLSVFLKGVNLFDKDYQDVFGYRGHGRSTSIGLDYTF